MKKKVIDPHSSFEQLKGPIRFTKCKPLRRIILDQKCTLKGNFLLYQYFSCSTNLKFVDYSIYLVN